MKILIAEDDTASRLVIQAMLVNRGHEVIAAPDGRQALNKWRSECFPVVISDWTMPELDGLGLCRAIRAAPSENYTYLILLTSHSGKTNYLEAIEAGVDDFLTKPLDEDALLARLHVADRILGLRRHMSQLEGLLPICAWCKKIRDEDNHWQAIEKYVSQRSEAVFTHGICEDCTTKLTRDAEQDSERFLQD